MASLSLRARALSCALLAGTAYVALSAQPAQAQATPREFRQLDGNGVDLVQGDFVMAFAEGSIGSGRAALALVREGGSDRSPSQWDNISLRRTMSGSTATIEIRMGSGRMERFTGSQLATSFTPAAANGASLARSGPDYVYTGRDGTQTTFNDPTFSWETGSVNGFCTNYNLSASSCVQLPVQTVRPDGGTIDYGLDLWSMPDGSGGSSYEYRLASVTNGFGQRIAFAYQSGGSGGSAPPPASWFARSGAGFFNDNVSTTSAQASVSYSYPSGSTAGIVDVTDMAGNVWRVTATSIKRPGESSAGFSVTRNSGTLIVSSVTRDGVTTSYSRSVSGSTATMTVSDALSHTTTLVSDLTVGRPSSVTDANSHTTGFTYDTYGRLTRTTAPEGNYVETVPDARGNPTLTRVVAKDGTTTLTGSASYPTSCTNPVTCNLPTSATDPQGNTTAFEYDSTHGGITKVTLPLPTSTATVHPETRYSYSLVSGVYFPTGMSQCQTGSAPSCVGTSDEVKATIGYDSQGNATSSSAGNGAGTLTASSAMTYDAMGNLLTLDGPLSGSADTTRYRYDAARRLVGVTSPDPDGSGSMKPRATKTTYNSSGLPTKVEQGNVNSQSDSDWAAFSSLQEVDTGYDSNFRPVTQSLVSGGTTYALTQVSYDAVGRLQCSAQRMNPTYFSSPPSDACVLGMPSATYGADRIVKTSYDAAGPVSAVTSAYGVTAVESDDVRYTYTNNGKVASLTDAENNKTSYVYDGFDRLYQVQFPSATKGANASDSGNYEQYGYDANGNVTSRRLRDGTSIGFSFDFLDRTIAKDLPGSDPDTAYTYDLIGRLTGATQGTESAAFSYDALGRKLTETGLLGTTASQWDAAGRRTRLTWPDGTYVDYDHLVTGETSAVRQNGATSGIGVLATYGYDDLGRRTSLTRGNAMATSYAYAGPQLTSLTHDLAGSSYDVAFGFTYNPAGQIVTRTSSNTAYAYTAMGSGSLAYGINGLNQTTAVGTTSVTSDGRGNLTSDGTNSYTFSSENRVTGLITGSITTALGYDPLGRWTKGGASIWLGWDGDAMVIEKLGSAATKWVHGAGGEPLIREDPDGTWHWMYADERGSTLGSTLNDGSSEWITIYDEYGRTAPGHGAFRHGYAGQVLIGSGLSFARNRVYSLNLGRFLQADPIGYGAGMNMYDYAGGDPVNRLDPSGLTPEGDPITIVHPHLQDGFTVGSFGSMGGAAAGPGEPNGNRTSSDCDGSESDSSNCTVAVTATPPTPFKKAGFGTFGHDYRLSHQVCRVPLSPANRAAILRRSAVPGHAEPVDNGVYLVVALDMPGGYVNVRFSADYNQAVNITTFAHVFVGSVYRHIYSTTSGTNIDTIGTGFAGVDATGQLRDLSNQIMGPLIFTSADRWAAIYARDTFPGC